MKSHPNACYYVAYTFSPIHENSKSLILELEQLMLIPYGSYLPNKANIINACLWFGFMDEKKWSRKKSAWVVGI